MRSLSRAGHVSASMKQSDRKRNYPGTDGDICMSAPMVADQDTCQLYGHSSQPNMDESHRTDSDIQCMCDVMCDATK